MPGLLCSLDQNTGGWPAAAGMCALAMARRMHGIAMHMAGPPGGRAAVQVRIPVRGDQLRVRVPIKRAQRRRRLQSKARRAYHSRIPACNVARAPAPAKTANSR